MEREVETITAEAVYVIILSKISSTGINRKSYSDVVNEQIQFMEETDWFDGRYKLPEEDELITGATYVPATLPCNSFIRFWFDYTQDMENWADWMDDWTQVTMYKLYTGSTSGVKLA